VELFAKIVPNLLQFKVIPTWKRLLSATSLNEEQGSGTHEGNEEPMP